MRNICQTYLRPPDIPRYKMYTLVAGFLIFFFKKRGNGESFQRKGGVY